jgi:hypothetical protein
MAAFLTVAAKHCRQAEHSLQLAAGLFNGIKPGEVSPFRADPKPGPLDPDMYFFVAENEDNNPAKAEDVSFAT